jgi:hypothetical protein
MRKQRGPWGPYFFPSDDEVRDWDRRQFINQLNNAPSAPAPAPEEKEMQLLDPQPPKMSKGTIIIAGTPEFAENPAFKEYFKTGYEEAFTLAKLIEKIDAAFEKNKRQPVEVFLVVEGYNPKKPGSQKNQFQLGRKGPDGEPFVLDLENQVTGTHNIDKFKPLEGKVKLFWLYSCAAAADQKTNAMNVTNQLAGVLKGAVRAYSKVAGFYGISDGKGGVIPGSVQWKSYSQATDIPKPE